MSKLSSSVRVQPKGTKVIQQLIYFKHTHIKVRYREVQIYLLLNLLDVLTLCSMNLNDWQHMICLKVGGNNNGNEMQNL